MQAAVGAHEGVPGRNVRGHVLRYKSVAAQIVITSASTTTPGDIFQERTARRRGHPVSHIEVVTRLLHVARTYVAVLAAVSRGARCARARSRGASDCSTVDAIDTTVAAILGRDIRGGARAGSLTAVSIPTRVACARARSRGASDCSTVDAIDTTVAAILGRDIRGGARRWW